MSFEYFETINNNGLPLRWLEVLNDQVSKVKGRSRKEKWSSIVKHFVRTHCFPTKLKFIENHTVASTIGGWGLW